MEKGDGYESSPARGYAKPAPLTPYSQQYYPSHFQGGAEAYQMPSSVYSPHRDSFGGRTPPTNSTETTLGHYPEPYQYNLPESSVPFIPPKPLELNHDPLNVNGTVIHSAFRRHLLAWILAFLAICCFVFTTIFAWNATGGVHADSRLLFDDPGRTILVLQILTNVTTALFGELVIMSCEMVIFHKV